jgi:hypothetical protein
MAQEEKIPHIVGYICLVNEGIVHWSRVQVIDNDAMCETYCGILHVIQELPILELGIVSILKAVYF